MERLIEKSLFASRWLLAPVYLGLSLALVALGIKFFQDMNAPQIDNDKLLWYVIIHLTFVVSAVMMGVLDRMAFAAHREH